jgi:hypothetical protein
VRVLTAPKDSRKARPLTTAKQEDDIVDEEEGRAAMLNSKATKRKENPAQDKVIQSPEVEDQQPSVSRETVDDPRPIRRSNKGKQHGFLDEMLEAKSRKRLKK